MKRVICPKCKTEIPFDHPASDKEEIVPFSCPECGHKFRIKILATLPSDSAQTSGEEEGQMPFGYISIVENKFCYKQIFPLQEGDNVIGRSNKDTDGVDIAITTTDPSMGRKHCVINVNRNKQGKLIYTLRDFPSLTGTFLGSVILEDKDRIRIEDAAVVTIGATTFILHTPDGEDD